VADDLERLDFTTAAHAAVAQDAVVVVHPDDRRAVVLPLWVDLDDAVAEERVQLELAGAGVYSSIRPLLPLRRELC
jgi:hypothetical protein